MKKSARKPEGKNQSLTPQRLQFNPTGSHLRISATGKAFLPELAKRLRQP
jgi:hypothetical protein